ncbi:MAG: transporter substrate-binding protein [Collimonas fungivorans]|uniref:ABC transporter substrate-binding protein n=1 Tax=Collimonas fungivorans TaxID=158899 RepID=UPI0026ED95E6|nr:ABC transporter substrate-binding protein [Collimonas fungivorans]MDB5768490.1 transporter substrate-binding protein [Collimonas fungivorans]
MKNTLSYLLAGGLALLAAGAAQAEKRTLVISAYPIAQPLFAKHVYEPFKARCGCDIVVETGNNADRIAKLEAHRASPVIDLVLLSDFGMLEASNKGLIAPLDYAKLKNYGQLYNFAKNPIGGNFAVGYTIYSVGLVYRSDKISGIKSWQDLWRSDLKGRISLPDVSTTQGPLMLQMADLAWGGKSDDYATGMQKITAIKNNVVTFSKNSAQLSSLFAQDEIWAAPVARFTWSQLLKTGMPLKWSIPAEGQAAGMNVMGIVSQSKNADLAYQLIDFWLSKEVQTALAMDLVDSPVNQQVVLPKDKAEFNTYGAEQIRSLKFVKPELILKQRSNWIAQWNKAISK